MKKQNGITLVALIITIIVMVILAGVVIASAVADGGIIDRAQNAMKEKERAEAEELVIASYVYKTTASTSTIAVLNLDATADAIYENLTTNGFTLIGASSGNDLYTEGNSSIDLNIQGKQGNYTGTVTDKGLEDGLKDKDETGGNSDDEDDNTGSDNEIVYNEAYTTVVFTDGTEKIFEGDCYSWLNMNGLVQSDKTIEKIYFGTDTKSLMSFSFSGCSNLSYVYIPNSVGSIGEAAFNGCVNLSKVVINSESITLLTGNNFQNCTNLNEIIIYAQENSIAGSPWGATNATITWKGN